MPLLRRLTVRRLLAALLLACLSLYGIESAVADVHDGAVEQGAAGTAPAGTPQHDDHPVHVCHCAHTHLLTLVVVPGLGLVITPGTPPLWRLSGVLPSTHPVPQFRPPIA